MLRMTLQMDKNSNHLSFFEHVDELRGRLIKCIVAVIIASWFVYLFIDQTMAFLIKPIKSVVFTAPGDAFLARITLTLFGAFFVAK